LFFSRPFPTIYLMSTNPLLDGLQFTKDPTPFAIVIFGATGDLTRKKLIPALFSLFIKGNINQFKIIGFARRPWTNEFFREQGRAMLDKGQFSKIPQAQKEIFLEKMEYLQSTFQDPEGYKRLPEATKGFPGKVYYLSTPPEVYGDIIGLLGYTGLNKAERGYSRVIVEKPFGRDLASAKLLNGMLARQFEEHQIYRIDHYLGKETVQNVMALRFGNAVFEPLWNNKHIDHIQITVAESIGIGTRGNYYEKSGTLRDMVQNHIFQILTLLTMEPPSDSDPDSIRTEKVKVLKALRPITHKDVEEYTVRGQYTRGIVEGEERPGYKEVEGVAPDSKTETFIALKIFIDNWRWAGVPIFIRSGKSLTRKVSEVMVQFKSPPHNIYRGESQDNSLIIHIQPEEGITWNVNAKIPGYTNNLRPVNMDFAYGSAFGDSTPEAYERLILDALLGDSTLYTRKDEIETSWAFITRILQGWASSGAEVPTYRAGSSGPEEAKALIGTIGQKWRKM
jgi:glucose-6-phosphate 1-dehydrogenase